MSVKKRTDGRWAYDVVIHRGKERIRDRGASKGPNGGPARNRAEALKHEQARRAELEGGAATGQGITFKSHSETCMSVHAAVQNKASSISASRSILDLHLLPHFGDLLLEEIDALSIARYKAAKLKTAINPRGLKPKTINNSLGVLSKFLGLAKDWGRLRTVPTVGFMRVPEQPFDFLDFDEAARLIAAAAREPEWLPMVLVAFRAGLRQGEILELRFDDLDLVRGLIRIRRAVWHNVVDTPKGGRGRDVPMGEDLRAALRGARHLKGELVFSDAAGERLTKGKCRAALWRICKRAGLRRIGWHVGRHSFASHLVMRGAPLKAVQELLGHTTMEMTMKYAHLSPHVGHEAVRLLDAAAAGPGTKATG
jgi:integrase